MNVYYTLRRTARLMGERTAIFLPSGNVNYTAFHERVLRAANVLRSMGVEKGDRVAVLMLNNVAYMELYFATAVYGAIIVPINTRLGQDETAFWLNDSGSKVLVVDDRFAAIPEQLGNRLETVKHFVFAGVGDCPTGLTRYEDALAAASSVPPGLPEPEDDDVAGIFYTSGTTGGSKGVMLTHRNVYSNALHITIVLSMTKNAVYLHAAPMFHLADAASIYALVMLGAGHCFIPGFDPEAFLRAVEQYRVTNTILVPTMINMLLNHPAINHYDTSSLTTFFYGASPMPLDVLRRGIERFGNVFWQGYGLSESSPLLTMLTAPDHRMENTDRLFTPVKSAGQPVLGVDVRVVDLHDRDLPPYEMGEIIARGDNIMKGYWNRPEITADTLRGGWLHTGDIGAFDEKGYLYILDRKKDMIKTGGENVHSPEVEAAIFEHPSVLEAAVIGVPDAKWGESIKAVVVVREGHTLTAQELIAFCRTRLTHFKCPSSVDFIDALPKGGTGKIQKAKLREPYWRGERAIN